MDSVVIITISNFVSIKVLIRNKAFIAKNGFHICWKIDIYLLQGALNEVLKF